jgi:hypothetical protein
MSRAFVKETDDSEEIVPHRPISRHLNLVTAEGLALIERHLTSAVSEREAAQSAGDHSALARAARGCALLDFPSGVSADCCRSRNDGQGPAWKHRDHLAPRWTHADLSTSRRR